MSGGPWRDGKTFITQPPPILAPPPPVRDPWWARVVIYLAGLLSGAGVMLTWYRHPLW